MLKVRVCAMSSVAAISMTTGSHLASALDATASASDANSTIEEIVVTAQRREERLQNVPMAVTAVSQAQLVNAGISDTASLTQVVPGLDFMKNGNSGNPFLRGVGSTAGNPNNEQSIAFYIDGVYIASPTVNLTSIDVLDVERIEVLAGPQGTLFGRNATGGVIQVITKAPSQTPSADMNIGYGNFNSSEAAFYGTTGLGEHLAANLSLRGSLQGEGWGTNDTTMRQASEWSDFSMRSSWLYTPIDSTTARLNLDYSRSYGTGFDSRLTNGTRGYASGFSVPTTRAAFYDTYGDTNNGDDVKQGGASLHLDQTLDWGRLVSISAYRYINGLLALDQDTTPVNLVDAHLTQRSHNVSQELQVLSPSRSLIQWIGGAYYYRATAAYDPASLSGLAIGPALVDVYGNQTSKSWATFGQMTAPLVEATRLTLGLRYTEERIAYNGSALAAGTEFASGGATQKSDKLTYRAALNHDFTSDIMGYLSQSRGFKSGGFNILSTSPASTPSFKPETLDSTEVGLKTEWLDHRLQINGDAFYYRYSDIQLQITGIGGLNVYNAAKALIKGLELETVVVPIAGLNVRAGLSFQKGNYTEFPSGDVLVPNPNPPYGDTHITDVNLTGKETVHTPHFTSNISADYIIPMAGGDLTPSINWAYNSGFFYSVDNLTKQSSYSVVNSSLKWRWASQRFDATLWVKNMLNKEYYSALVQGDLGDQYTPAPPRTYGLIFAAHF